MQTALEAPPERQADRTERRCLVIDDHRFLAERLALSLEDLGFTVDRAYNGEDALRLIDGNRYDVILADWNLGHSISGLGILKHVRSTPGIAATPFIMITAASPTELALEAAEAGVSAFLLKPIIPAELARKVMAVTRRSALEAERPLAEMRAS
ncbi:MAG TPA: response regulator [Microvirga sp.]|jgi:two-component system chemotaxis response regulator CheY|nr:response regulator [Microvirga sp.]